VGHSFTSALVLLPTDRFLKLTATGALGVSTIVRVPSCKAPVTPAAEGLLKNPEIDTSLGFSVLAKTVQVLAPKLGLKLALVAPWVTDLIHKGCCLISGIPCEYPLRSRMLGA
jgi:hypothetical protein